MFCKYCGKEMDDDALFCSKCGKQVVQEKVADSDTENSVAQEDAPTSANKTEKEPEKEQIQEENKAAEKSVTKEKKGKSKTGVKIILGILTLAVIGGGYIGYRKVFVPKSVDAYIEKNYPIYEAAKERFNEKVQNYNERPTTGNAENSSRAGLDMIEAYLDYYKGKVKVQGSGDYSNMNKCMDEMIALVESNHSIHGPYREENMLGFTLYYGETDKFREYFENRIESLKAEWRRIRQ